MFPLVHSLMPSTRKQKAKTGRSREMDMLSDYENMDVIFASEDVNPFEKKSANTFDGSITDNDAGLFPRKRKFSTRE